MNLAKPILLLSVLLMAAQITSAQTEGSSCQKLLENGLYRTLKIDRGGSFEKDLKTYFASDSFKSDFKDHKWGGDLSVLIPTEGGPVLSADDWGCYDPKPGHPTATERMTFIHDVSKLAVAAEILMTPETKTLIVPQEAAKYVLQIIIEALKHSQVSETGR